MKIQEINVTTGEEIVRDSNSDELAQYNLDQDAELAAQEIAAAAKAAAEAKLAALGLTVEDLKALGL